MVNKEGFEGGLRYKMFGKEQIFFGWG